MASKCSYFGRKCLFVAALVLGLLPGHAIAQDTCRDTILFLPCDYWARRFMDTSAVLPLGSGDTMAVPPGASAPMSGMSGMWDGAQLEVVTTDPQGVGVSYDPGPRHALVVDSKSRVYAVYYRAPSMILYFSFKNLGQPWSPEVALPASPTIEPRAGVVIGPRDVPEFLYLEGGNYRPSYLVHTVFNFDTRQWAVDTIVHTTRGNWPGWLRVDIAADSLGGFHVVWDDPAWNEELHAVVDQVVYAENTSGNWRTHIVATVGAGPLIQVEPTGRAFISYGARLGGHVYDIFASNRSRGDTVWTADTVDTAPAYYGVADMRLGSDGTLHVLFAGVDCYGCMFIHRLFYTRRLPGSRMFEPWYQLYDHGGFGRLFVDCAGCAHAWYTWYDEEEKRPDMYYATNASGAWITRPFHFGDMYDGATAGDASFVLDRFDQGRVLLTQGMDDRSTRLLYYASPTVYFDVFDVVRVIDHVYGDGPVCDPDTYDEDCNGTVDAADVVWIINYCFSNGPNGCRF